MKIFTFIGSILLFNLSISAQVTLPYSTGFDNTPQQNGWTEYKKAATTFSHWNFSSANAFSTPNCISHDYSPSTGITLTDNWFVSPSFSIVNGGSLDSIRYMFSGFSVPGNNDTVAIYLLNGSQDPSLATSKTLLFDFRGTDYNADNTYRIQTNINLPSSPGLSYFAIRYRNSNNSANWLTVHFDNIAISGSSVGINDFNSKENIKIYPSPATNKLNINTINNAIKSIHIFNINAEHIYSKLNINAQHQAINVSKLSKGIYFVKINTETDTYTKKFIIR